MEEYNTENEQELQDQNDTSHLKYCIEEADFHKLAMVAVNQTCYKN